MKDFDLQLFAGGAGAPASGSAPSGSGLRSFAEGTTIFPTPIMGLGGSLTSAAAGGNISILSPIPATGFLGRIRHNFSGTLVVGTQTGTQYRVPLHRLIQNYTINNSLTYNYRSLNGGTTFADDLWMWANLTGPPGSMDPIYGSSTYQAPVVTSTGSKAFAFSFLDQIGLNDGVNFSKFLISCLTNSNQNNISIQWMPFNTTTFGTSGPLSDGTAVFTPAGSSISDQVSAEYYLVPDAQKFYWPDVSKVQQVIGDQSFNNTVANAQNSINLTPISGPAFMGIGLQILKPNGTYDPITPAGAYISQVSLLAGGTIPMKIWNQADLVQNYEAVFGRPPAYGYYYVDMMSDLDLPNVMSRLRRKNLATNQYAQLTLQVVTTSNYTGGSGALINQLKRTYQSYAGNAANP